MATVPELAQLDLTWTQKLLEFESRLQSASSLTNPNLTQLSQEFASFKEVVIKMLNLLRQQVNQCIKSIDKIEMRHRQKIILFNGITENPEQDVEQEIVTVIQNKMGLQHVIKSSFKRCHRLGTFVEGRTRPILVHFYDHTVKSEVWRAKTKLKGSAVNVVEFLTRARQAVFKRAREQFSMKNVWSLDGTIHVKTPDGGRVKIVSDEELDHLVSKYSHHVHKSPVGSPARAVPTALSSSAKAVPQSSASKPQLDHGRKQPKSSAPSDDKRPRRAQSKNAR